MQMMNPKRKNMPNLFWLIAMSLLLITSCKKDKGKTESIPTVITKENIISTPTSATVSGEITDDGNLTITEAGFVYSSNVDMPTTADNKKTVADYNAFSAELTGLTSGTTYNVRAYAINSKGTAYGEKRSFITGNAAPVASDVQIDGTLELGNTLTASYTYMDAENDAEGATAFQWYMANSADGTGEQAISGATSQTFIIGDAQNAKFISVGVTPKASAGTATGSEVKSDYIEVAAETVTFTYNGQSVTYGTITSTTTQKKWLDRNLGAGKAADSIADYAAYGDLFQWGRLADGHQLIMRTGATDADAVGVSGTTSSVAPYETSSSDVPANNKFIIVKGSATPRDWRDPQNNSLWQGVNGINNPCPAGWRVPTADEFKAEAFTSGSDAFAKLKLTLTGQRNGADGSIAISTFGDYWSSTIIEFTPGQFASLFGVGFDATTPGVAYGDLDPNNGFYDVRRTGKAVRCIKD
jgi:hypothetical protein